MDADKSNKHQELDMIDFGRKSKGMSSQGGSSRNKAGSSRKSGDMKRLHISIGDRKGVRPRHLLAAIIQSGGVDKDSIGKIDVYDKFSFVEVDKSVARKVMDGLNNEEIKGTRVRVEIAKPRRK